MIEKLKKFCGDPKYNEKIGTPWSAGEFSFATNGFILVRVPRVASVPERENALNLKTLMDLNPEPQEGYVDAPGIADLAIPECPRCKGKESSPEACEECNGAGVVELSNRYHDYECTCQSCGGDGEHGRCSRCASTGYLINDEEALVEIAGAPFKKVNILKLTREFGDLQVAPPSPEGKASWMRFAGGHILTMPVTRAMGA